MGTLLHASSLSVPRGLCCTFMHVQSSGETGRGSEALWLSAGSWRDLLLCFLNTVPLVYLDVSRICIWQESRTSYRALEIGGAIEVLSHTMVWQSDSALVFVLPSAQISVALEESLT